MSLVTRKLGEITTILSGTTPKSDVSEYWNGTSVWVTPTDLGSLNGYTITGSERKISDAGLDSCNLTSVPRNSVVMSTRAPIGHLAIAGCDLYTNQGCKSFVCGEELDSEFLFFLLMQHIPTFQSLGSGATFKEVSKKVLESYEIIFPRSKEKQRQIATRLKAQLAEIEKARQAAQMQLQEINLLPQKILSQAFESAS